MRCSNTQNKPWSKPFTFMGPYLEKSNVIFFLFPPIISHVTPSPPMTICLTLTEASGCSRSDLSHKLDYQREERSPIFLCLKAQSRAPCSCVKCGRKKRNTPERLAITLQVWYFAWPCTRFKCLRRWKSSTVKGHERHMKDSRPYRGRKL